MGAKSQALRFHPYNIYDFPTVRATDITNSVSMYMEAEDDPRFSFFEMTIVFKTKPRRDGGRTNGGSYGQLFGNWPPAFADCRFFCACASECLGQIPGR
jgi:hypothetical protein